LKIYRLDPDKFPRVQRNTILTYFFLSLVGLGVFYLNIGNALFNQAWMLIPLVFFAFTLAGWLSLRDRRRYWDEFEIIIRDNALTRRAPKLPDYTIKNSAMRGFKEVRQGIIIATASSENTLIIPRDLPDNDYRKLKQTLENWTEKRD
jgi:hypothetical protein